MTSLTERVFKTIGPHFVTLSCVQYPPESDEERVFVFSGFVVDIQGAWVYVTAGHILQGIRQALDLGYSFDHWRLDDQTAGKSLVAFKGMAVPYSFDIDDWLVIENEEIGIDYAAVRLEELYCLGLKAGGTKPLAPSVWGSFEAGHDHWVLVGTPKESVEYDGVTKIEARVVMAPITPASAPLEAGVKSQNQFYAQLADDPDGVVSDIDGMSGGPIFGLAYVEDRWLYQVIGVQSAWYPGIRTLAACPFSIFAKAIEGEVKNAREDSV